MRDRYRIKQYKNHFDTETNLVIETNSFIILLQAYRVLKLDKKYLRPTLLRGVIFKIQPLRNPPFFNNMICVQISKVLLKGM